MQLILVAYSLKKVKKYYVHLLSSSWLLNIERLLILKQQRNEDLNYWRKIIEENESEAYRQIHAKPNEAEH